MELRNLNGTARYRAMGGAFGAVGGDLSALNVNPPSCLTIIKQLYQLQVLAPFYG